MSKLPQLLILVGGMATRLEPLSTRIPKSLIEVKGKPFIFYQLEQAKKRGIEDVVLCIGNMGDEIFNVIGNGDKFGLNIKYSDEGNNLLGTGGAINNAKNLLKDYFFVLYGDSWINTDYKKMFNKFQLSEYPALISVYQNKGKWDRSNIEVHNKLVVTYNKDHENKKLNYIDYGLSILSKELFFNFNRDKKFDLGEIYSYLSKQKQLEAFEVYDRFYEIGSFQGINETSYNLQKYL